MKVVIQRVNSASVEVDSKVVGSINKGLLIFVGISKNYSENKLDYVIRKILNLRLWASEKKGFDLNIQDVGGEILVVSQFTLFSNCYEGNKPKFNDAAEKDLAKKVYEQFVSKLKESGIKVETGKFAAMMKVRLENDGPVTIILEK